MFKKRFISILALLMTVVTGAWAQQETLLTTIVNTGDNAGFKSGSKTFDNIATVTFSGNVSNDNDDWGWYSEDGERTLTVTAAEGYTITRVKFYTRSGSAFDEEAPFEAILVFENWEVFAKVNGTSIGEKGVTQIDVYGYADTPATVAVTGVTLAPTEATLTLGETETVTLIPTVLPGDATDKSVTWSSSNEAVATVTDGVVTAVAAGTATITVTTTDEAKTATCAVTVAAPAPSTYTVTLKEGTDDANKWEIAPAEATTTGVAQGTEVTATYGGVKKVKSVKAVKKAAPAATVTTAPTAKTGVKAGQNEAIVNAGTATGGTMMYMVNATRPASTDGFSATVPTAEGLTAGTYYVWYYVKADDSHTDSEISATGIEVTIASAYTMAAAATSADKGKLICTDGHIHAYGADAACTKARVAKIIYIGTTGDATYNHGLALALTDEANTMAWQDAIDACSAKNTNTPVTGATWLQASYYQWGYMLGTNGAGSYDALRTGFTSVGGTDLQSDGYWSSTQSSDRQAYYFNFNKSDYFTGLKTYAKWVRACLAF